MTARKPLVLDGNGHTSELPAGDSLAGAVVESASGLVDFGFLAKAEQGFASTTISASWVTSTTVLVAAPYAVVTADHDPEDYAAENIHVSVLNVVPGVGFDVIAYAPFGSWGKYAVNILGV